jgi:hypothetical protein
LAGVFKTAAVSTALPFSAAFIVFKSSDEIAIMDWKLFFRPDKYKILIAAIIFLVLPVFPFQLYAEPAPPNSTIYVPLVLLLLRFPNYGNMFDFMQIYFVPLVLVGIVASYAASSAILHLWRRISPERKKSVAAFLKISRWKLIIFAIGFATAGILFSGSSAASIALLALLPFTLITLAFNVCNFFILISIANLISAPYFENPPQSLGFESYGTMGPLANAGFFVAIVIEWYLLSCLVVYLYHRFRKKGQKLAPPQ